MAPCGSQDLRSPSPIMAPVLTQNGYSWFSRGWVACERWRIFGCHLFPPIFSAEPSDSRKYVCVRRLEGERWPWLSFAMINSTNSFSSHLNSPCLITNWESKPKSYKCVQNWGGLKKVSETCGSSCYCIWRKLTRLLFSVPQLHLESSVDAAQSHGLVTPRGRHVHLFDNCQVSLFKKSLLALLINWLSNGLTDWLTDGMMDWLTEWLKRRT